MIAVAVEEEKGVAIREHTRLVRGRRAYETEQGVGFRQCVWDRARRGRGMSAYEGEPGEQGVGVA